MTYQLVTQLRTQFQLATDFTTHVITASALNADSVFAIDVDGDGDIDVLSASSGDDKIAWYENDQLPLPSTSQR